jgi:hypothetical protein
MTPFWVEIDGERRVAIVPRPRGVLGCLLCDEGLTPTAAFQKLSAARGAHVPDTAEQIRWVEFYAQTWRRPLIFQPAQLARVPHLNTRSREERWDVWRSNRCLS